MSPKMEFKFRVFPLQHCDHYKLLFLKNTDNHISALKERVRKEQNPY